MLLNVLMCKLQFCHFSTLTVCRVLLVYSDVFSGFFVNMEQYINKIKT